MMARTLLVALGLLAISVGASAERLYKWVDKDGTVHYGSSPPRSDVDAEQKNIRTGSSRDAGGPDLSDKPPVVLYMVPKCGACDEARTYLNKRGVPFTDKNVDGDPKAQEELRKKSGGLSVPTITIGEKVMRGYMESLLEGELDNAGYPKVVAEGEKKQGEGEESAGFRAPTR
jgi:glutaredoxin